MQNRNMSLCTQFQDLKLMIFTHQTKVIWNSIWKLIYIETDTIHQSWNFQTFAEKRGSTARALFLYLSSKQHVQNAVPGVLWRSIQHCTPVQIAKLFTYEGSRRGSVAVVRCKARAPVAVKKLSLSDLCTSQNSTSLSASNPRAAYFLRCKSLRKRRSRLHGRKSQTPAKDVALKTRPYLELQVRRRIVLLIIMISRSTSLPGWAWEEGWPFLQLKFYL